MKRIHLVASGGGAACGAHSAGKPNAQRDVLASHLLALVDCKKCRLTDQYRNILNPPRQYQLRLFAMTTNTNPPRRLGVADIAANAAFHRVEVLLDGEPQPDFVSYDAERGWVERYARDGAGRCVIIGEGFATERVAGAVEVRWRKAA